MQETRPIPGMPRPRTPLIGRARELDIAHDILLQADTRLLTLTGVGGCGKTRLAYQLTTDIAPDYPQRVWGVELAAVVDAELIPIVVARTLGLHESSAMSSMAGLTAFLGSQPTLLLLDNCEHLIDACAEFVDTLLGVCPDLRVLATSREPLHIAGERQFHVPPLDIPVPAAPEVIEMIADVPAVELFVARTQAVDPRFELTPGNAAAVSQICARLDGIPLALELAAARMRVLGVEQLLARLDESFQLLTGGSRVAPLRHQTLHAALAWSSALLTECEQSVFRRLAVFAGEFQLQAVEALCEDLSDAASGASVLNQLTGLVDKSLVMVAIDDSGAWYRLLEPVRQHALEQLVTAEEATEARSRHAAYYLNMAEQSEVGLRGPDQALWLDRLEREHGNLRAALDWAHAQSAPRRQGSVDVSSSLELRLATALAPFWEIHGHLREGLHRLSDVLERGKGEPALRVRALAGAGRLSFFFNHSLGSRYTEAEELTEESLRLARELDDQRAIATALSDLGFIHRLQEDFPRSIVRLETALAIFRDLNDEYGTATALLQLGIGTYMHVDPDQGTRLIVDSLDRFRALGDTRWAALAQAVLGRMAQRHCEFERGIELTVEAMTAHLRLGDRWFVSWDLFALADVLIVSGQLRQGVRFTGAAQALSDHLGSPVGGVSFHKHAARIDSVRGEDWFDAAWASGYALDPIEAVQAARALLEPSAATATPSLTPRELEVAHLLAKGYTDAQIAEALFIAVSTVGTHVHHILQKLDLQSRMQVADWLDSVEPSDGATG